MGNQVFRQTINARQPPVRISQQLGQLFVEAPGQIQQDVPGVSFQDILIIEDPVGGRRGFLLQAAGCGKVGADLPDPQAGLLETLEQFVGALRLRVQLLLSGMAPGMFQYL